MLKGLGKLVNWHIIDTALKNKPLNNNLYSYREGISTENAHRVLHKIENALANNEMAIVVFLDISGAFSDTSIEGMIRSLKSMKLRMT